MRIGELARQAGVKAATIRFYEMRGVLPPPERDASGYRRYDETAPSRLRFVTQAREVGLSVDEIAALLGGPPDGGVHCEEVGEQIRQHRDELNVWLAQATQLRDALDRALQGPLEHGHCEAGECPVLARTIQSIHERPMSRA